MYLILTKTEYSENWELKSYADLAHAKSYLLEAVQKPGEVLFAQALEFSIDVKIKESTPDKLPAATKQSKTSKEPVKEGDKSEASEGGPEEDSSPGDEGHSPVR